MNNKPIFILGAPKSGITLLRNIFYGHHNLHSILIPSSYFNRMNYWLCNLSIKTLEKRIIHEKLTTPFLVLAIYQSIFHKFLRLNIILLPYINITKL